MESDELCLLAVSALGLLYDFIACQSPLRFTQQFPVTALNDTSLLKIRNFFKISDFGVIVGFIKQTDKFIFSCSKADTWC